MFFYWFVFGWVLQLLGNVAGFAALFLLQFAVVYTLVWWCDKKGFSPFKVEAIRSWFASLNVTQKHRSVRPLMQVVMFVFQTFNVSPFFLYSSFRREGMKGFDGRELFRLAGVVCAKSIGWAIIHNTLWFPMAKKYVISLIVQGFHWIFS